MSKVLGKVVAKVKGPKDVKDQMKEAIRKKYIVVNPKKNESIKNPAPSVQELKNVKQNIKKKFAVLTPDHKGGAMVPKFLHKKDKKTEK